MEDDKEQPVKKFKDAYDVQRMRLEKLMKNPDKPAFIPERPKESKTYRAPDFVRNVMGSSAGAGSGEFHVYRHLRRKEYARQKQILEQSEKERLDEEFKRKVEEKRKALEEKTAKKRAKRLKRKEKLKQNLMKKKLEKKNSKNDDSGNNSSTAQTDSESDGAKATD